MPSDPSSAAPVASTEDGRRLAELLDKMTPEPWEVCGGYTPAFSAIKSPGGLIVWAMADRAAKDMHGRPIEAPDYETQRANIGGIALARNLARRLLSDSERLAASEARCKELAAELDGLIADRERLKGAVEARDARLREAAIQLSGCADYIRDDGEDEAADALDALVDRLLAAAPSQKGGEPPNDYCPRCGSGDVLPPEPEARP